MTKAQELRVQLDARKEAERKETERERKESQQKVKGEVRRLVPAMLRECIKVCEEKNRCGRSRAHVTFDGYPAQNAAPKVAEELRKENFEVSYNFDTYGFRMDSEGYTLTEGTPYVSINISW